MVNGGQGRLEISYSGSHRNRPRKSCSGTRIPLGKQGPKDAQCHVIISRHDRGEISRSRSSNVTAAVNASLRSNRLRCKGQAPSRPV